MLMALVVVAFIACSMVPVTAQIGLQVSPSVVDLGVVGRGGTATRTVKVYNFQPLLLK